MRCVLEVDTDVDELYRIFLSESLESKRASCDITKGDVLRFEIQAQDPTSMKAFTNSILKILQTYEKIKDETGTQGKDKSAPEH